MAHEPLRKQGKEMNKTIIFIMVLSIVLSISTSCSQKSTQAKPVEIRDSRIVKTPADAEIEKAKRVLIKKPESAAAHLQLALAILQKVRETGDYTLNAKAAKSIERVLEKDPKNFGARLLRIQILLSEHGFQEALDLAKELQKEFPKSEAVLLALTDAKTELGLYEEAVESAQRLVDFRPNANSYVRVALLRSLHGDVKGAIEARKMALKIVDPNQKEVLAWHHSQLGNEYFNSGRTAEAESEYETALKILPGYHWALDGKGRVRAAQNDLRSAEEIFRELVGRTQEPERVIFLADLVLRAGRASEATKLYEEIASTQEKNGGDMHRIALLWADRDINIEKALDIAKVDREENKDLRASDTLAWCLFKSGRYSEAKKFSEEALRLGSKNALFFFHAGMIEDSLGNKAKAINLLQKALDTNPNFDLQKADVARKKIASLS